MITFLLFLAVVVLLCTNVLAIGAVIWLYKDHECAKTVTDFLMYGNIDGARAYVDRKEEEMSFLPIDGKFYKLPYMILEKEV